MFDARIYAPRALGLLRIVAALLYVEHATMKFFSFPVPLPGVSGSLPTILVAAGLIELVAGALMTVGLFTRIAAFVASGEMAAAYFMVHLQKSFWPAVNQGEVAILFCFVFLYLVAAGGGAWTVDGLRTPKQVD